MINIFRRTKKVKTNRKSSNHQIKILQILLPNLKVSSKEIVTYPMILDIGIIMICKMVKIMRKMIRIRQQVVR